MNKERRLRWLGHAHHSDNSSVKQLIFVKRKPGQVQPVGRPFGALGCTVPAVKEGCEGCEGDGAANGLSQTRMEL